jgi:hypothetical protein
MIENDNEFQEAFKEYAKSKGVDYENRKYYSCDEDLGCNNCILKDVRRDLGFCTFHPFEEIKRHEKQISLLKQDISIMSNWKRNCKIENKLKDFCKTFRSDTSLNNLTCRGIDCEKCPFEDMDNFREWARKMREESLG